MDQHQTRLVQATLESIAPIADTAAALFYGRLFELDPSLREMFPADLRAQGRKFMDMLTLVVRGLSDSGQPQPAVRLLGHRHAGYGARPEHYGVMGSALLWTLKEGLGAAFTPEVEEAWLAIYDLLATTMQGAGMLSNGEDPAKQRPAAEPP